MNSFQSIVDVKIVVKKSDDFFVPKRRHYVMAPLLFTKKIERLRKHL